MLTLILLFGETKPISCKWFWFVCAAGVFGLGQGGFGRFQRVGGFRVFLWRSCGGGGAGADRTRSTNNLKQMGVACHSFHDSNGTLPLNGSNTNNYKDWCWAVQILSYIEQDNLYRQITSGTYPRVPVKTFLCPGRPHTPFSTTGGNSPGHNGPHTDYAINNYSINNNPGGFVNQSTFNGSVKITMTAITSGNGTSNTILIGEKAMDPNQYGNTQSANWDEVIYSGGYGGTGRGDNTIVKDTPGDPFGNSWGSPFNGGCPFLMCDGSVRLINYSLNNSAIIYYALNTQNRTPFTLN
jgi:prepilin-type processing-associated H-X9-DG protein